MHQQKQLFRHTVYPQRTYSVVDPKVLGYTSSTLCIRYLHVDLLNSLILALSAHCYQNEEKTESDITNIAPNIVEGTK